MVNSLLELEFQLQKRDYLKKDISWFQLGLEVTRVKGHTKECCLDVPTLL